MDNHPVADLSEVELDAYLEELDDAMQGSLSTAGSFSSAATFVGGCFSSAACFSTASS